MRINQFVALATGLSRRAVDTAVKQGRISVNGQLASLGQSVQTSDIVTLDNNRVSFRAQRTVVLLNKPVGYVCSKDGQGSPTIYDLLPIRFSKLKYVGRLDKDSSGLIIMTNDGQLSQSLSHPSFNKSKLYDVLLDKPLKPTDQKDVADGRVEIDNKPSLMKIRVKNSSRSSLEIKMNEGRNRQIRRTFESLGYKVIKLNRRAVGPFKLEQLGNHAYLEMK